jgi:hypothetical protein
MQNLQTCAQQVGIHGSILLQQIKSWMRVFCDFTLETNQQRNKDGLGLRDAGRIIKSAHKRFVGKFKRQV